MKGSAIIDLQFGSTGKGLIAGYLAKRDEPDTLATAWAANAGHTFIDTDGTKYVHTMLANGIVSRNLKRIMIGPGSLINPEALKREIRNNTLHLLGVEILIHPSAAVITPEHVAAESDGGAQEMGSIGSTKKGVGAAAAARIRRDPEKIAVAGPTRGTLGRHPELVKHNLSQYVTTSEYYLEQWDKAEVVQIEGAQGYGLSMYHGSYPHVTSRDVSLAQLFADVALPVRFWSDIRVVGCVRTYPIRVSNASGWSGPGWHDQREISWARVGVEPELTTVTKLPRRIFTYSVAQVAEAVAMCGVHEIFLNFVNYCDDQEHAVLMSKLVTASGAPVTYLGFGPGCGDVLHVQAPQAEFDKVSYSGNYNA